MNDTPQVLLTHYLKALRLPTFLREYDKLARQCAGEDVDYPRYLLRLAELEMIERERRTIERRIKDARFPVIKSLDSFEFAALPSLNKTLVLELARSEYIARRENIIAVGNSGTGKTHLRAEHRFEGSSATDEPATAPPIGLHHRFRWRSRWSDNSFRYTFRPIGR
jgi:DNA replication protein DnaC